MVEIEATIKLKFVIENMTKAEFNFRTLETQKSIIMDGIKSTKDFDWIGVIKAKDVPYETCEQCGRIMTSGINYFYFPTGDESFPVFCTPSCLALFVDRNCIVKTVGDAE